MTIDKSWTKLKDRYTTDFTGPLTKFCDSIIGLVDADGKIDCPCAICCNNVKVLHKDVFGHILTRGFLSAYNNWIYHGEEPTVPSATQTVHTDETTTVDDMDDMDGLLNDVFQNATVGGSNNINADDLEIEDDEEVPPDEEPWAGDAEKLFADMEKELYPGCKDFSVLSFIVHLMHTKVNNKWTNASFDVLLELMSKLFKHANIPPTYYKAKCYMRALGLGYQSIHACLNDCVLFWKDHKDLDECPTCQTSRWVKSTSSVRKVPQKVLRYFPVTPRLKRMFSSRHTASDMTWHHKKRDKTPGMLRHPADGEAWKHFDKTFPDFAAEPRNIRLGLATDGFNPFGNMSNSYSMWPVLLFPYNMAPWKCMSDSSFMMPLLIPGRKSPGKNIDVFMQPLIQELKQLWSTGVDTYDASEKKMFRLRACVLWTIHDFPAYGYVSGWSTSGYKACPTCNDDTTCIRITDKQSYIGHRRFLPAEHRWRKDKRFNGKNEMRSPPKLLSGDDILKQLQKLPNLPWGKAGVKRKRDPKGDNWTKKSILFDLPYWSKMLLRNNIDVMHVEKNIFDNILTTLLDLAGSKDNDKSREDLKDMGIRQNLWLKTVNNRVVRPRATYVLPLQQRREFCKFLKTVKYPDGVASNISSSVNDENGKVLNLKTHDCHMLLQRILPIGIRQFVPKEIAETIIELGHFFKRLTARTLAVADVQKMKEDIVIIICKLETIYPPAFFTIMIHLAVHLPDEALLGGPVPYRWMYKVERKLGELKKYVRNKARPEGSIAEGYCISEALNFCSKYLAGDVISIGNRPERYAESSVVEQSNYKIELFNSKGRVLGKKQIITLPTDLLEKARWYCLTNCPEIEPYLDEHRNLLLERGISSDNIAKDQEKLFPKWLESKIVQMWSTNRELVSDELYALASAPDPFQFSYPGCVVNGIKYLVKNRDDRRRTQNSGVHVPGVTGGVENDYFGVLEQVFELQFYNKYRVLLMKCKWFDTRRERNHVVYDKHFTTIDTNYEAFKEDPFIYASQANQVYYIRDPTRTSSWYVIESFSHRHIWDVPETDDDNISVNEVECSNDVNVNREFDIDDLQVNRGDDVDLTSSSTDSRKRSVHIDDADEDEDEDDDETLLEYDDEEVEIYNEDDIDDQDANNTDIDLSDDEAD